MNSLKGINGSFKKYFLFSRSPQVMAQIQAQALERYLNIFYAIYNLWIHVYYMLYINHFFPYKINIFEIINIYHVQNFLMCIFSI